jgi:purine nucleosidase
MARVQSPLRLLVDTDTASDDAVALLLAACSGRADIEAVTTVAGNVGVEQATRNALYTLQLAGFGGVPVHPGCDRPLIRPHGSAQHVHGMDGMSDSDLPAPRLTANSEHAVDALRRIVGEHPEGTFTLVTLGPLTNVAAVVVRDRYFLGRLRHVYCMAGAADLVGNISPSAEYNVWADPEAAAIVLAQATPDRVTLIGWDVSRKDAVMAPADQAALAALGTPLASFANDVNQAVNRWTQEVTGLPGYDLPDPIAMAIALDPSLALTSENVSVSIALGDEARGQLLIDRRYTAPPPNVNLVRDADAAGFKQMLMRVCSQHAAV